MAMKKKLEAPRYQTRDLAEAAFVSTELGLPRFKKTNPTAPVYFSWGRSEKAAQLSSDYWGGGKVEGLKFAQMQRSLKDLIFGRGDAMPLQAPDCLSPHEPKSENAQQPEDVGESQSSAVQPIPSKKGRTPPKSNLTRSGIRRYVVTVRKYGNRTLPRGLMIDRGYVFIRVYNGGRQVQRCAGPVNHPESLTTPFVC
jgi:hypothetical protein